MAASIYALCALSALFCTYLLFRSYARGRHPLLLWSALCFAGLTLNNILLMLDKSHVAPLDLTLARDFAALSAMLLLLYGLIWHAE